MVIEGFLFKTMDTVKIILKAQHRKVPPSDAELKAFFSGKHNTSSKNQNLYLFSEGIQKTGGDCEQRQRKVKDRTGKIKQKEKADTKRERDEC